MKWIRGRALKTLLALRPLAIGDEVMIKPCRRKGCPSRCAHYGNDELLTNKEYTFRVEDIDDPEAPPVLLVGLVHEKDVGLWVHPHNIRAWRMPG